jgi:hypothetical protein
VVHAPPELPGEALFHDIACAIRAAVGWPTTLLLDRRVPAVGRGHAFAASDGDVRLMCVPWQVPFEDLLAGAVELAPVVPVYLGARAAEAFPLRAVLLRRDLPQPLVRAITEVFASLHLDPRLERSLRAVGLLQFLSVAPGDAPLACRRSALGGRLSDAR